MLNETCDVDLNKTIKFYGKYTNYQNKLFRDHGIYESPDLQSSDFYYNYGSDGKELIKLQNYTGKLQYIPGAATVSSKQFLKTTMENTNHTEYLPKYFIIPDEMKQLEEYSKINNVTYILKPFIGTQGDGIQFANNVSQVKQLYQQHKQIYQKQNKDTRIMVQEYVNSQLIDGRKIDLRIHIAQTSVDPLGIYIYKEGFGRFSGIEYNESMLTDKDADPEMVRRMIATNLHIQQVYQNRSQQASWSLTQYLDYMKQTKPDFSEQNFWDQVYEIVQQVYNKELVKSLLKYTKNQHHPSQYFRQMGIDILPMENGTLKLLEINHYPGLSTIFETHIDVSNQFFNGLINLASIRPKGQIYNKSCNEQCKQKFLNSVFDDSLTEDQKIALLQIYDERKLAQNFIPVKPLDELKDVGKYNDILIKYWDQIDNPFNNNTRVKIN